MGQSQQSDSARFSYIAHKESQAKSVKACANIAEDFCVIVSEMCFGRPRVGYPEAGAPSSAYPTEHSTISHCFKA